MRPADIADLLKGLAIDVREYIAQALAPVTQKQADLEQRLAALPIIKGDPGPTGDAGPSAYELAVHHGFAGSVDEWLASLQGTPGERGESIKGEDGKSVTVDELLPALRDELAKALADLPRPQDGKSITAEDVQPLLRELVDAAVATLPAPQDGESVTVDDVRPLVDQAVADAMQVVKDAAVEDVRPLLADDIEAFTAALTTKFASASCHAG
jgi:hypothetical protein